MKRYSASQFRQHVARALDEAERGETVIVERRGRTFRVVPDPVATTTASPKPMLRVLDRRLLDSDWSWDWKGPGRPMKLTFKRRRAAR